MLSSMTKRIYQQIEIKLTKFCGHTGDRLLLFSYLSFNTLYIFTFSIRTSVLFSVVMTIKYCSTESDDDFVRKK